MQIEDLISRGQQLLTDVQAFSDGVKGDKPHLCNASGAFSVAVRNLTGHKQALAAAAAAAEDALRKAATAVADQVPSPDVVLPKAAAEAEVAAPAEPEAPKA